MYGFPGLANILRNDSRITDGGKRRVNWAKRYIKMKEAFNRSLTEKHSHVQENQRRRRQISKGMITESNGLVVE